MHELNNNKTIAINNDFYTLNTSILGMHMFGCRFCEKSDGDDDTQCDRKNFDTLLWAIVTVFQVKIATLNIFDRHTHTHEHYQTHGNTHTHTQNITYHKHMVNKPPNHTHSFQHQNTHTQRLIKTHRKYWHKTF